MHKSRKIWSFVIALILLIAAIAALFPFVYMVLVSFTQKNDLDLNFDFSTFSLENYRAIFRSFNMASNMKNSIIVTVSTVILNCIVSSMAAYSFAKTEWKGRNILFLVYLATLMIPGQVTMIPVFTIIKKLNWMNTYRAIILPMINAFGVFLIKQFIESFPNDLLEVARIDGCGENRIFVQIVIPLIKPVLISLTIFTFITSWNQFLWPLIVASKPSMQTLTLAVATLKSNYLINYGLVMAGSTLTFLPPFILYLFLQEQFVQGIALSGIKG